MQPEQAPQLWNARVGLVFKLLALCCTCAACGQPSKQNGLECDQGTVCTDSDCDTICDREEDRAHRRDTDHDGTPDFEDLDSDADGIPDLEEAGDDDPSTPPIDRNLDGKADYLDKHYPLDAGKDRPLAGSGSVAMGVEAAAASGSDPAPPSAACSQGECASKFACPGPDDAPTEEAHLYVPFQLDAADFYAGDDVRGYRWYVTGSPCDRMFVALNPHATTSSGVLSVTLENLDQRHAQALFTSAGDYDITLRIITSRGDLWCNLKIHVVAPGIRVELCWDKTGPTAGSNAVDLDLHLAKAGVTTAFFTPDDCYEETCGGTEPPWDYASTAPLEDCTGASAQNYAAYESTGACPNPRLDAANRLDQLSASKYVTEAIALDAPRRGDRFRVMVHYASRTRADADGDDDGGTPALEAHPIVNVYCDGELRATVGGIPEVLGDSEEVGLSYEGQMWRAADIVSTDGTCEVTELAPPDGSAGHWVSGFDTSYAD
jgi:hypothetical protein